MGAPPAKPAAPKASAPVLRGAVENQSLAKRYLEPASWAAVILGIGLGLSQLYVAHRDRKVDAALTFAERFSDETTGNHRRALEALWLARPKELQEIREKSDKGELQAGDFEDFKRKYILIGSKETSPQAVVTAIAEIADFMDQLHLCVESGRCDREVSRDYFCRYATSFLELYRSDLADIHEAVGHDKLGAGLRAFVTGDTCVASPDRWYWPF